MILQNYLNLRKKTTQETNKIFTLSNAITVLRTLLIIPVVFFGIHEQYTIAIVFAGSFVLGDMIDGHVARILKSESKLGRYLDPIIDKIGWISVVAVILYKNLIPFWIVIYVSIAHVLHPIIAVNYQKKTGKKLDKAKFQALVNIIGGIVIFFGYEINFLLAWIVAINSFHLYYYTKVGFFTKKEKNTKVRTKQIGNEEVLWYGSFSILMFTFIALPNPNIGLAAFQLALGFFAFSCKWFLFKGDRQFHILGAIWMTICSMIVYQFWGEVLIIYIILAHMMFFYLHRSWHKIRGTYPLYLEKNL